MDNEIYLKIKNNWDSIAKPLGGLGVFEELVARIGAAQGLVCPDIKKRAVVIMCADNGIVEENISQSGQEVTLTVAKLMGMGRSSVCHLAKSAGIDVIPVDIGINSDEKPTGVRDLKIARGTVNFLKSAAMTEAECKKAIEAGERLAEELKDEGYKIICAGEMGIGNTTTASAVSSCILGLEAYESVGRGAGLDDEGLKRKLEVVDRAIKKYGNCDVFNVLMSCGGLDIAGMTGLFIGSAKNNLPVVIDGAVSAVSALCAARMQPDCAGYMIPSHAGREGISKTILKELGLYNITPVHGKLAFGEGTGAVLLMPVLDSVMELYNNGERFSDTSINAYEHYGDVPCSL